MASLNWNITGINRDQIANEIATLRAQSETFRRLEQMASDEGYRNIEVTMGPRPPRSSIGSSFQRAGSFGAPHTDQFEWDCNFWHWRTADHGRRDYRA
jgi:hypothetical protein